MHPLVREPTRGFEPLTARLQVGCAANCATSACPCDGRWLSGCEEAASVPLGRVVARDGGWASRPAAARNGPSPAPRTSAGTRQRGRERERELRGRERSVSSIARPVRDGHAGRSGRGQPARFGVSGLRAAAAERDASAGYWAMARAPFGAGGPRRSPARSARQSSGRGTAAGSRARRRALRALPDHTAQRHGGGKADGAREAHDRGGSHGT